MVLFGLASSQHDLLYFIAFEWVVVYGHRQAATAPANAQCSEAATAVRSSEKREAPFKFLSFKSS